MEQQESEEGGDADQYMEEQEEVEEHGGDNWRPFQVFMQTTHQETLELMVNGMRQLQTDFYDFRNEMRRRMDSVDGKIDQIVNHFFPPPPPSAT
ncbi:hypothetical protein SLEP1_g55730 [Rubroshorea leprosula]|uniref:Uncharacterized protein n=1 Tax=Rubroshorea leprosula TaxID=152421 RepID=A0AAV5MJH8_9ROSI|nr:hypothetical protein SLEP1_g55730 [Rubroshorea leprosula]